MKRASILRLAPLRGRFFRQMVEGDHDLPPAPSSSAVNSSSALEQEPAQCERLILQPMVRQSYYEHRGVDFSKARGQEPFVAVGWDEALKLVAEALAVTQSDGAGIYGGCYSRSGGGTFHDPQSQLQRFLQCAENSADVIYTQSYEVEETLAQRIMGEMVPRFIDANAVNNCKRVVCFGAMEEAGFPISSSADLKKASLTKSIADKGIPVVKISPVRDGVDARLRACWLQCRPNSEAAVMMGLIHTLIEEELYDREFVDRYCTGFDIFADYIVGATDGVPKSAAWAAAKSLVSEDDLLMLARLMAAEPCVIRLSASVLNIEHGEQALWAAIALVAALGYLGASDAGLFMESSDDAPQTQRRMWPFVFGSESGPRPNTFRLVPFPRLAEMLESPGRAFQFNGKTVRYPNIGLIYLVSGSNDHPNFNHLRTAWSCPRAVVCHESCWTPAARLADIVLPHLPAAELKDFEPTCLPQRAHTDCFSESLPEAWSDYEIFSALAERLGFGQSFTLGKCAAEWIKHLGQAAPAPHLEDDGAAAEEATSFHRFLSAPETFPLRTPSGKIEIFSQTIANFGYRDCGGHPVWYEKREWLGGSLTAVYPFHLLSTRSARSIRGGGSYRRANEREHGFVRINPRDALRLQLKDGDMSLVSNARGGLIAKVLTSTDIICGVLHVIYDSPLELLDSTSPFGISVNGNPCTVTSGVCSSALSQAATIHSCLVNIEKVGDPVALAIGPTGPDILYNVSPSAIRFASRR